MYIIENLETGEQHPITSTVTIGRADSCAINLSGELISREHARITVDGENVSIEDLNSTNGSKLNYKPLKGKTTLAAADVCSFGSERFVFMKSEGLEGQKAALAEPLNKGDDSFLVEGGVDDGTALRQPVVMPPAWSFKDYQSIKGDSERYSEASIQQKIKDIPEGDEHLLAHLILLSNHATPKIIGINSNYEMRWKIGRTPLSEIEIKHPTVSEAHAILSFKDSQWLIEVFEARNPLYVNNQVVKRCRLENECLVRLGEMDYLFVLTK